MTIQIYNSQSRRKEPFAPLSPPDVTLYNCGPTVYDRFHIGNARTFVAIDVIRRYLAYRGYNVRFVQNLTDIDDKIIDRARDEGISADQVTAKYIPAYFEDARKLRIREANDHPCATGHVPQIVALIERLIERGMAYAVNGSVYFRVARFPEYGKLSGRKPEDMLEGARVEVNAEKENPADFAMWKAAKPGEPQWDSPWGPGRPGWHIECSAMAMALLGETIDIHAGGVDLQFPHHENEIAQSEGATGKPFARYWMHCGFLNIDREKMSKSLGNFLKIDQALERWSPAAVRHFMLSAHYRGPLELTDDALDRSTAAVQRINDAIATCEKMLKFADIEVAPVARDAEPDAIKALREKFEAAMDDDFNIPKAMGILFDVVAAMHVIRSARQTEVLIPFVAFATELRDFFGIEQEEASADHAASDGLTEPLMQLLIDARAEARKAKTFAVADMIRDRLAALNVTLEDHPQGTIWKRKE